MLFVPTTATQLNSQELRGQCLLVPNLSLVWTVSKAHIVLLKERVPRWSARWKPSKNSRAINQDLKTITPKTHKKPPVIQSNLTSRFNFCRIYKVCWLEIGVFWFCFIYFGVENQSSAFFAEDSQKKSETCKMETQTQAWTSWWILTFLLNHMLAIKPTSGNSTSVPVRNQRQINCYTGTDQWFMSCNIKLLTILIATHFRERSLKWQDHSLQWFEVLFFLDFTCWN